MRSTPVNHPFTTPAGSGASPFDKEQNRNKHGAVARGQTMNIRKILLAVTEVASMGLLTGAIALWAVALSPMH
jgi:hypothetical protein